MKTLKIATALAIATIALPMTVTAASAYQCVSVYTQAKVHKPTRLGARIQSKKSWTYKVKTNHGLAWSLWQIAKHKTVSCEKAGQRWVCTARAKRCKYTPVS